MSALKDLFAALLLLAGSGWALEKTYIEVRKAALIKAHQGLPSLTNFTQRLTCSKIAEDGRLVSAGCKRASVRRAK